MIIYLPPTSLYIFLIPVPNYLFLIVTAAAATLAALSAGNHHLYYLVA